MIFVLIPAAHHAVAWIAAQASHTTARSGSSALASLTKKQQAELLTLLGVGAMAAYKGAGEEAGRQAYLRLFGDA